MSAATRLLVMCVASIAAAPMGPAKAESIEGILAATLPLTAGAINAAPLVEVDSITTGSLVASAGDDAPQGVNIIAPSASIVRLQILLDRAGVSPGVIDGLDGNNLRKAISGYQLMQGWSVDGKVGTDMAAALETTQQAIGVYQITAQDQASVVGTLPTDYGEMAELDYLGYQSVEEGIAERFHMDVELLRQLNPGSSFAEGQPVFVADVGERRKGQVAKIEVHKALGQLLAYAVDGALIAAYPATIGREDSPSPTGTHIVKTVVNDPTYTYNPKINFQQGSNDKVLTLQPGPNNPVGTVWIDLSEPTYGIHGTPEPNRIDKTGSHGCVRLTNWDARALGEMLTQGVPVTFLD